MAKSVIETMRNPFTRQRMETIDLDALFGKPAQPESTLPCVRFKSKPARGPSKHARGCRLGGHALLPPGVEWPSGKAGPLAYVGQLDFEHLASLHQGALPLLPKRGVLSFFFDMENQPWGNLPSDREGWKLLYVAEPEQGTLVAPKHADAIEEHTLLAELSESKPEADEKPVHQVGGHAVWVQGDGRGSAQLVSSGIQLTVDALKEAEKRKVDLPAIGKGCWDWTLLWQINSDDSAGILWGDCGALYILIRQADLEAQAFERAWVELQCY